MNWIPRFVGPDFVVMPEEISTMNVRDQYVVVDFADTMGWAEYDISKARPDRPTGLTDWKGKAIFENDILQWDGDSNERVVFDYGEFIMRTGKSGPDCPLWKEAENAEVVGMVAYGEEGIND